MQDNDPKHISKFCLRKRGTVNPSTDVLTGAICGLKSHLTRMNLTGKSEQNNLQVRLTSTSSLWWKECQESVKQRERPRGAVGHSDESKVKEVFLIFFLFNFLFSVAQGDVYLVQ